MDDRKKIKKNLIMGIIGQLAAIFLGIAVPKLVLTSYGSEVNGLLSSVTNIYAYIAIVESGIAAASCQALYAPLANNDKKRVNAVLAATNKYYYRTGIIYCGLIALFSAVYPMLIQSKIPYSTIVLVILLNGIGNVINYFFHSKYLILLKADGKRFVEMGMATLTNVLKQLSKIILITLGYNVVCVQFVAMLMSFAQMIYITLYIKKHYSWIDLRVTPDHNAISQSRNVVIHEISYLITANVDVVLLTAFSTLKIVSVYSLYNLLFGMINKFLRIIRDAYEFKIAHLFHSSKEEFYPLFHVFESCYMMIAFALFSIANYFVLPFLEIYTAGVSDVQYINELLPPLFVMIHLLSAGRYPSDALIHISGHFKQTQKSAVIESVINVIVSLILVQFWGIAGVLLGTIASSLYRTNYLILYVNHHILGEKIRKPYVNWIINFAVYIGIQFLNRFVVIQADSYVQIVLYCIPYTLCVISLYIAVMLATDRMVCKFICSKTKEYFLYRKRKN